MALEIDMDNAKDVEKLRSLIGKEMKKTTKEALKEVKAEARLWARRIKKATPRWRQRSPRDRWDKMRIKAGRIAGTTQRAWRKKEVETEDSYEMIIENMEPNIRVLEFGGFALKTWGNYAGKVTPRTRPSPGSGNVSNVSKQAPQGMVRTNSRRSARELREKLGE